MDLAQMHHALAAAHAEEMAEAASPVEGLDRAACGPHMKHLAQLAAAAAAEGVTPAEWRSALLAEAGPETATAIDTAETCMHESGLWPWNAGDDGTQGG